MLAGLILRGLGRWLEDHFGVDINQSKYSVEWLGHSHVQVHLSEVALTRALWRFIAGPVLPLTIRSGKAQKILVEISSEDVSVEASGVTIQFQEVPIAEWPDEAKAYRAKALQNKDMVLSARTHEGELKKWIRGKLRVAVSSLQAVLQTTPALKFGRTINLDSDEALNRVTTLAALCSSVVVGAPAAAHAAYGKDQEAADFPHGPGNEVPFDKRSYEDFLLTAKDCTARGIQIYFSAQQHSLPSDWLDAPETERAAYIAHEEDRICSPLVLQAAYRAWTSDALSAFPECAQGARKVIALHVNTDIERNASTASNAGRLSVTAATTSDASDDVRRVHSDVNPVTIHLDRNSFNHFMDLFLGLDSIMYSWLALLSATAADVNGKPTLDEASLHVHLARGGSGTLARGFGGWGTQTLQQLEQRWAAGFVQRLRNIAKRPTEATEFDATLQPSVDKDHPACCPSSTANPGQFAKVAATELSPRIPATVYMAFDEAVRAAKTQGTSSAGEAEAQGAMGAGARGPSKSSSHAETARPFEFSAEAAYRISVPDLQLHVNLAGEGPIGNLEATRPSRSKFHISAQQLGISYARDLDAKYVSLSGNRIQWLLASKGLVDWSDVGFVLDYFGQDCREIRLSGRVSTELPTLWAHLQLCPGIRPVLPCSEALKNWYTGQAVPAIVCETLDGISKSLLTTALNINFAELSVVCRPEQPEGNASADVGDAGCTVCAKLLPSFQLQATSFRLGRDLSGTTELHADEASIFCMKPDIGLPTTVPVLSISKAAIMMMFGAANAAVASAVTVDPDLSAMGEERTILQLDVVVPTVQVNLTPVLVHVALHHRSAYASLLRWDASKSAKAKSPRAKTYNVRREATLSSVEGEGACGTGDVAPKPPKMAVALKNISISLWSNVLENKVTAATLAEKVLRCQLVGLSFRTGVVLEIADVVSTAHLEFWGLLGEVFKSGRTRSIFICTSLEDCRPSTQRHEAGLPAFRVSANWCDARAEAKFHRCELHMAPTPELVQQIRMLLPGVVSAKRGTPAPEQGGHKKVALRLPRAERINVRMGDASLGLHMMPSGKGTVLLPCGPEAKEPCMARTATSRLSAFVHVRSFEVGASTASDKSMTLFQLHLDHVDMSVTQTFPQAYQPPRTVSIAFDMINGAAVMNRDAQFEDLSSVLCSTALVARVGSLTAWASSPRASADDEPGCEQPDVADERTEGENFGPGAPRIPGVRESLRNLVRPRTPDGKASFGTSPCWLELSLNGANVHGCSGAAGAQADGFYALEPRFVRDRPVYRKLFGGQYLVRGRSDAWEVVDDLVENAADAQMAWPSSARSSCSTPSKASTASKPLHVTQALDGGDDLKTLALTLGPTLISLCWIDAGPVRELAGCAQKLALDIQKKLAAGESQGVEAAGEDEIARESSGTMSHFNIMSRRSWRLVLSMDVKLELPESPACPSLRLQCVPNVEPSVEAQHGSFLCEFQHLCLELRRPAVGDVARQSLEDSLVVCMALHGVYVRLAIAPRHCVAVRIDTIRGEHQVSGGQQAMFFRPGGNGSNLTVIFQPGRELFVYIDPIAVRLHRGWVAPMAAFVAGVRSWRSCTIGVHDSGAGTKNSKAMQVQVMWEGPVWIFPEGENCGLIMPGIRRIWLQLLSDGSLWEISNVSEANVLLAGHPASTCMADRPRRESSSWSINAQLDDAVHSPWLVSLVLDTQGADAAAASHTDRLDMSMDSAAEFHAFMRLADAEAHEEGSALLLGPRTYDATQAVGRSCLTARSTRSRMPVRLPWAKTRQSSESSLPTQMAGTPTSDSTNSRSTSPGVLTIMRNRLSFIGPSFPITLATSTRSSDRRTVSVHTHNSPDSESAATEETVMNIDIEVKRLELWLFEADALTEDPRSLGLWIAAEAHGYMAPNCTLEIGMPLLAVVRASSGNWDPTPVNNVGTKKTVQAFEVSIQNSFARLLDPKAWQSAESRTPPGSPKKVASDIEENPFGCVESEIGASLNGTRQSTKVNSQTSQGVDSTSADLGVPAEDQLMIAYGLESVVVWEPHRIIGVRLRGITIHIPIDLLRNFSNLKTAIAEIAAQIQAASVSLPAQAAPTAEAAEDDSPPIGRTISRLTLTESSASYKAPFMEKWFKVESLTMQTLKWWRQRERPPPLILNESDVGLVQSKSTMGDSRGSSWYLEVDVAGRLDVKVSGGQLAPSHWLVAEVSNIFLWGPVAPRKATALTGIFSCTVKCYDATSAMLEPVLEPVEVTVDVRRRGGQIDCAADTTRLNVNIQKVLVDFCFAVHRGLREAHGKPLVPIHCFDVLNETGVDLDLYWRPDLDAHVPLPSGCSDRRRMKDLDVLSRRHSGVGDCTVSLRFTNLNGIKDAEEVQVELDYRHSRAYVLPSSGCPIIVEPENNTQQGLCVLRVQSAVTLHNHTALPLSILLDAQRTSGLRQFRDKVLSMASVSVKLDSKQQIRIGAWKTARVPLDWFSSHRQQTRIKPDVDNITAEIPENSPRAFGSEAEGVTTLETEADQFLPRIFPQLSGFLEVSGSQDEDDFEAQPQGVAGDVHSGERMKFNLFFHRYMKIVGYVDAFDVPVGGDPDDMAPRQRFDVHFGNVVAFRNMLPFPVILQLCAADWVLDAQPLPLACIHEAFGSLVGGAASKSSDRPVHLGLHEVPCFGLERTGNSTPRIRWRSSLDGVLQLTLGRTQQRRKRQKHPSDMIASFVLGVDEEVSLPLAKRVIHLRVVAFAEKGPQQPNAEDMSPHSPEHSPKPAVNASQSEYILLPPANAHVPRSRGITLQPIGSPKERGVPMQVSIEMTRNTLTLYAPVVVENLTPCTLKMHPKNLSYLLGPMSRRLLPHHLYQMDMAFIGIHSWGDDDEASPPRENHEQGHELMDVQDLDKVHHLRPMRVPAICPPECGCFTDVLCLGVCVRTGAPPLRLTKILSIFPRFVVRSDLQEPVKLRFCKKNGDVVSASWQINPGERLPVHPSSETMMSSPLIPGQQVIARSHNQCSRPRMCFANLSGSMISRAFPIEPRGDDSEQSWTYHVQMVIPEDGENLRSCVGSRVCNVEVLGDKPLFAQVDIKQGVLPAKESVPYPCGSYFVTLRQPDFRGSEDALIHIQNWTQQSFYIQVGDIKTSPVELVLAGKEQWVRHAGLEEPEIRYRVPVRIFQDERGLELLGSVDLGSALIAQPHAPVVFFEMCARLHVKEVCSWKEEKILVKGGITLIGSNKHTRADHKMVFGKLDANRADHVKSVFGKSDASTPDEAAAVDVQIVVEDCSLHRKGEVYIVNLGKGVIEPKWFRGQWQLVSIAGERPQPGDQWRRQLLAATHMELRFESRFEGRHFEGSDGVQHFKLQVLKDGEKMVHSAVSGGSKAEGLGGVLTLGIRVTVPVLSVGWVHRHREVLALKIKSVDMTLSRERSGDWFAIFTSQHMQIDHFMASEMPVMLNRRFLHINSRWLEKKALRLFARWVPSSRTIRSLEVELVPYWMNLEIGVLIRLWDLAEGSFSYLRGSSHYGPRAAALEPPRPPRVSGEEKEIGKARVWRLQRLVVQPLRLTVHVRSPDADAASENPTARWIMRLPADMPNMDMILPRTVLNDRYGSFSQLIGALREKYKRRVKYSFLTSIILSYLASIIKALINAIVWLIRGPFDALTVAYSQNGDALRSGASYAEPESWTWLWWVSPLVHGTSEGTYRAFAELVGNVAFGLVLILNAVRHVGLGMTRPRAQSILDGLAYGFRGFFMDTLITPFSQLYLQTQLAYQDWGPITSSVIFVLTLLRIPFGWFFGSLNLIACTLEGLSNVLLHEEAQFANFEPQRTTESVPLIVDSALRDLEPLQVHSPTRAMEGSPRRAPGDSGPKAWWLFQRHFRRMQRITSAMMDDDEMMEMVQQPTSFVFKPGR